MAIETSSNEVRRALGREARDFRDFARAAAGSGVWSPVRTEG
jgi:hypothetical protein